MDGDSGREREELARSRELWTRWVADGHLEVADERALAEALAADEGFRKECLQDQRLDGALRALGRVDSDGAAFARRFFERVAAERDPHAFLSLVEQRMRAEGVGRATPAPAPRRRWPWLLVPVAAAALLLPWLVGRSPRPPEAAPPVEAELRPIAPPRPAPVTAAAGARSEARPATIVRTEGSVLLVAEARTAQAQPGAEIAAGAGVFTVGRESRAVVAFPDGSELDLEGDTVLAQIAEGAASDEGGRGKRAFLARGRLVAAVARQPEGRPLTIATPHARATVLGTRFSLLVDAKSSRLDVEDGRVELVKIDGGRPVLVRANEYALASEGRAIAALPRARGMALMVVGSLALARVTSACAIACRRWASRRASAARARPPPRSCARPRWC
jgi:hypothetical protein